MSDHTDHEHERAEPRPRVDDEPRVITNPPPLEATLPADLATGLGRLLGREPVETLAEWTDAVRRHTGGGSIAVEDLCHVDRETGHWGTFAGERYDFACFFDAVVLAALADAPVGIRTVSPGGAVVRGMAAGSGDLAVAPASAVFSFGVAEDLDTSPAGGPSQGDVYRAVCPSVRAFPDAEAYNRWTRDVPAVTVGIPLAGATDLVAALVA